MRLLLIRHGQTPGNVLGQLDTVGIADPEPLLRHLGHRVAVTFDLVLVLDDVAVGLEVRTAFDLDDVVVADTQKALVDSRLRAAALDRHLVADAEHLLLDLRQLVAAGILEDEGVARPNGFAVDLEHPVAVVVLDPEVVPDRHELLAHLELGAVKAPAAQPHRRSLPLVSSARW